MNDSFNAITDVIRILELAYLFMLIAFFPTSLFFLPIWLIKILTMYSCRNTLKGK